MNKKTSVQGFAVFELLVASAIALIVLVMGIIVFVGSDRSFRFGQQAISSGADLRLAMDWITRDIRGAEDIAISGDTVTLTMPPLVSPGDVVYVWSDNQLTRSEGGNSKVIVTDITQFDISAGDTVAITLASIKPRLNKEHQLTSKVTMRN